MVLYVLVACAYNIRFHQALPARLVFTTGPSCCLQEWIITCLRCACVYLETDTRTSMTVSPCLLSVLPRLYLYPRACIHACTRPSTYRSLLFLINGRHTVTGTWSPLPLRVSSPIVRQGLIVSWQSLHIRTYRGTLWLQSLQQVASIHQCRVRSSPPFSSLSSRWGRSRKGEEEKGHKFLGWLNKPATTPRVFTLAAETSCLLALNVRMLTCTSCHPQK